MQIRNSTKNHRLNLSCRCLLYVTAIGLPLIFVALSVSSRIASSAPEDVMHSSAQAENKSTASVRKTAAASYGELAMAFEANQGQLAPETRFVARGRNYALYLTSDRTILKLANSHKNVEPTDPRTQSTLSMSLKGADPGSIVGADPLPGKANYFIGNDPKQWHTNVPTYERVVYQNVYPGVNLIYYGNQQQLEYDFELAPGASPSAIRLMVEGARALRLNRRGDVLLRTEGGTVTLRKPVSYQYLKGKKRLIPSAFVLTGRNEIGFRVGRYDKTQPLVIDPVLIYSTYFGSTDDEQGNGIAVDAAGSAYIIGTTFSDSFPTVNAIQGAKGAFSDALVMKLDPTGTVVQYSTYLGGNGSDFGFGIALDPSGNVYITGQTGSSNFPLANPLHSTFTVSFEGFVAKLNNAGSALIYSTYLGGNSLDSGNSIAADSDGNAYVTGFTQSRDFPTTNPFQSSKAGNAIFKTINAAGNWAPSDAGLLCGSVSHVAVDPSNTATLYAACDNGVFKSTNGGATWGQVGTQQTATPVNRVTVDPTNPATLYAATNGGVFKSVDGGLHFLSVNNGINPPFSRAVAIDPSNPNRLYSAGLSGFVNTSADGGLSWTTASLVNVSSVLGLVVESSGGAAYAATNRGVYKTTNGGISWVPMNSGMPVGTVNAITLDNANVIYVAGTVGVLKSINGGTSWTPIGSGPVTSGSQIAVDPTNGSNIYVAGSGAIFKTIDGGSNWIAAATGFPGTAVNSLTIDPANASTLYIGTISGSDVFVTKLNVNGSAQIYSTYVGGNASDVGNAIAVGPTGNAFVTGPTTSTDFPIANALQPVKGLGSDAFVFQINSTGSTLTYSTYLGGNINDTGRAIAVDSSGSAYVGGTTSSSDFPTVNPLQPAIGSNFINDVFVSKLNPTGSALVYSTYLGGTDDDQCFGLAIDSSGQASVTGGTLSNNFPVLNAQQPARTGFGADAFVTRIAASGSTLISSTYLGGSNPDVGRGIAVDSMGAMYVTGNTTSTNFPVVMPISGALSGFNDVFIAKLGAATEVQVTIADSPDPVPFGSDLTYTINVRNNGELPATGVMLTHTLPAGAIFVSANSTIGTCSGTGPVTCAVGALASGQTAVITVVVKPPGTRSISSTASVTLNEVDPIQSNNTATTQTTVDFAELSIVKKSAVNRVVPGSRITYVLIAKNNAGTNAAPLTITDTLPAELSFVSCTIPDILGNPTCSAQGGVVTASFPTLGVGGVATAFLTVQLNNSTSVGTVVNNTAVVSSLLPDPITQNNSSTASFTVVTDPIVQKSNGKVAFAADRAFTPVAEPSGIYVVNSDGTGEMLFPNIPLNSGLPSWSPDGSRLAYTKQDFSGSNLVYEIHSIGIDGTGDIKLTNSASNFNQNISWSPNGEQVAFIGHVQPNPSFVRAVYIANADGSGSSPLANSPTFLSSVDWSPDGTKFVYATDTEIFVMNTDATGQTRLTTSQSTPDGPTHDLNPRWSPDGTKILFTKASNNNRELYMMNADGSGQTRLFNWQGDDGDWSPDGQAVVFHLSNEIYRVNLDGTNLVRLTNNIYYEFDPSWQPVANPNPTPTPTPAPLFSLSGRVTVDQPGGFVLLRLTGPVTAVVGINESGNYNFIRLPAGQYTVTPDAQDFYSFSPANRTIAITNADVTNADFTGTFVPPNITGRITDINGQPLANIRVSALGQFPLNDTFTDANGFYDFAGEVLFRAYTIVPDSPAYLFEPIWAGIDGLRGHQVRDFVGTPKPAGRISGQIIEALTGRLINGIQVNLSQNGSVIASTTTSGAGFSFGPRPGNQTYVVSVPFTQTYTFEPSVAGPPPVGQIVIPNLTADQGLVFTASRRNTIQFASSNVSVAEDAGQVQVVLTRTGDVSAPATVDYTTTDADNFTVNCRNIAGNAFGRCDFAASVDTLTFAAGETSKSFVIPIINDVWAEGNETFGVALSNPQGATLGTPATAVITITDNETVNGTVNPYFATPFFVRQHYLDFLSREPEVGEPWSGILNGCPNVNNDPACDRLFVSQSIFGSQEFQLKGYYNYRFYKLAFNRLPLYQEIVVDMRKVTGTSPADTFQRLGQFATDFVQRSEFKNQYDALSNTTYVNTLMARYNLSAITTKDPNAPNTGPILTLSTADLINGLNGLVPSGGTWTRAQVLRAIADSEQVFNLEFNQGFVAFQYYGYLRRIPDTGGYNGWLNYMNAHPNDFRTMVNGFLNSDEYRKRFGPNPDNP